MESEQITVEKTSASGLSLPRWLVTALQTVITVALPVLLVLINARLLMSNTFLKWEYNRPHFPDDPYGFTKTDRLEYAPLTLVYLFSNKGIEFLGDQTFPDGTPLYNERELSHMRDVKFVTRGLLRFGFGLLVVCLIGIVLLSASPDTRPALFRALFRGSAVTVVLILLGLIITTTSFFWLFTQFHALFFEGDSWIFLDSDTLIRLFPMRFWSDAFALVFGSALVEALIVGGAMWFVGRHRSSRGSGETP